MDPPSPNGAAVAGERAEELSGIAHGLIAELNGLLADSPRILTDHARLRG